jgi:galactokinase
VNGGPLDDRVRGLFESLTGAPPAAVWSAPGRVNLIGEHVDYNDGLVLPIGHSARTVVAVGPRPSTEVRVHSAQAGDEAFDVDAVAARTVGGWARYVAGVLAMLEPDGAMQHGWNIVIDSTLPTGAGLSSSAALTVATALAVSDAMGAVPAPDEAARSAWLAETTYVGMPCGVMDQMIVAHAQEGTAMFLDCRSLARRFVAFDPGSAGYRLLVVDTRAPHRLVDGEYAARRRDCESAAAKLGVTALRDATERAVAGADLTDIERARSRHVVTEIARVAAAVELLDAGIVAGLGPLLSASHQSLRDDFEVTVPELDTAAAAAEEHGALGARMIGGGFGGSVLALVPTDAAGSVAEGVEGAFAAAGFTPPVVIETSPSYGASPG